MSTKIDTSDRTYAPALPAQLLRDALPDIESMLDTVIRDLAMVINEQEALERAYRTFVDARQAWRDLP